MPAVSEEELQQLREKNEKLRERIASAQIKKAENETERQREYDALQVAAENVRLEAQLAAALEDAKVGASQQGASGVLESAKAQLEAAEAQADATTGPVDTNAENQPKGTTGATKAVEEEKASSTPAPSASTTSTNGGN